MSEFYDGRQFVGIDLHRRRSVLVRMTESGEHVETVRILNDRDSLAEVMYIDIPEVVLEATYRVVLGRGCARAARCERASGASAGGKGVSYRRVKNDQRDAADLADLLRLGRLPHTW